MKSWTLADIPWDRFDPAKVDPEMLRLVKAAAMVEYNGGDYAIYLCNVFHDDPEFQSAAREWAVEEVRHGEALARWALLADPSFDFEAGFAKGPGDVGKAQRQRDGGTRKSKGLRRRRSDQTDNWFNVDQKRDTRSLPFIAFFPVVEKLRYNRPRVIKVGTSLRFVRTDRLRSVDLLRPKRLSRHRNRQ